MLQPMSELLFENITSVVLLQACSPPVFCMGSYLSTVYLVAFYLHLLSNFLPQYVFLLYFKPRVLSDSFDVIRNKGYMQGDH